MLEIHDRGNAVANPAKGIEFLHIEVAPLIDGTIFVSMTATSVDDEEAQLLDQEVASERVSTMDEVLALIRAHVRLVEQPTTSPQLRRT